MFLCFLVFETRFLFVQTIYLFIYLFLESCLKCYYSSQIDFYLSNFEFSRKILPVISMPKVFVLPIARSVTSAETNKGTVKSDLTKTDRLSEIHLHKWN